MTIENDLVNGTDRDYTHGTAIQWTSPPNRDPLNIGFFASPFVSRNADIRITYQLGQNLYTPQDIERKPPDPDDRPYGAWLYGAVGVVADDEDSLTSLQLSLGVVGPAALGEQVQSFVHSVIDSREPRGWDSQIKNEPALLLTFEKKWAESLLGAPYGYDIDASPYIGGALGNVFTHINGGMMLRFGKDLPTKEYGPPRIQPSTPGSGYFEPTENFNWYLFAGIEGRMVARNIFLDGNTFSDSASVDKELLVGDFTYGVVFNFGRTRVSLTQVVRTPEFDSDKDLSAFGSLGLTYAF
ncbi:lipid A deacylase LpxR family protein [Nisaea acidiphila]|uniref:Lipid A deacylase LpxR family protein n=1 Tax=Nisaea acidiphila TaxID=1862145 RepID=A0A9J7AWY5_9PROT|nr:lipid A deacylase LpxR family protein [Nisaea acidiphila]UUX51638.1 lipid A deacylase LpxR family protein [Nisaea acidiphila]